jgi:glycosyltransferase involved in cell wall biosynthesis
MKILLVHNYYRSSAPSGEDAVARNERKLLEDHGVEVVVYEKFNDDLDDSTLWKKLRLAAHTVWSPRTYREVRSLLERVKPDLVHVHSIHPQVSPSVYSACRAAGVPVVHTLHNYRFVCPGALLQRDGRPCEDCLGRWPWRALRHRCCRGSLGATAAVAAMISFMRISGAFGKVNRFVAVAQFARRQLVAGGLPPGRLEVKPNFLPEAPAQVSESRENYAVFLGRLTEEKGVRTLIHAWRDVPGLSLKIIGSGALHRDMAALAAGLGVPADFLGVLDRAAVLAVLGKARFLVVPSEWYETFGMVAIEAYACGTPVLASRLGALEEIVLEGETGLCFEAGNAADLAAQANLLAADPERARQMGHRARQVFLERFASEGNFQQLMEIYRRARQDFESRN